MREIAVSAQETVVAKQRGRFPFCGRRGRRTEQRYSKCNSKTMSLPPELRLLHALQTMLLQAKQETHVLAVLVRGSWYNVH